MLFLDSDMAQMCCTKCLQMPSLILSHLQNSSRTGFLLRYCIAFFLDSKPNTRTSTSLSFDSGLCCQQLTFFFLLSSNEDSAGPLYSCLRGNKLNSVTAHQGSLPDRRPGGYHASLPVPTRLLQTTIHFPLFKTFLLGPISALLLDTLYQ